MNSNHIDCGKGWTFLPLHNASGHWCEIFLHGHFSEVTPGMTKTAAEAECLARIIMATAHLEGDPMDNPQQHMDGMKARRAELVAYRRVAEKMRFGPAVLDSYDQDIRAVERAMDRALRINPGLV